MEKMKYGALKKLVLRVPNFRELTSREIFALTNHHNIKSIRNEISYLCKTGCISKHTKEDKIVYTKSIRGIIELGEENVACRRSISKNPNVEEVRRFIANLEYDIENGDFDE